MGCGNGRLETTTIATVLHPRPYRRISVALCLLFFAGWFVFVATGSVRGLFATFVTGSMIAIVAIQIAMGGYPNSGAFVMWGVEVTAVATLLLRTREAVAVGATIALVAITLGFAEQWSGYRRRP